MSKVTINKIMLGRTYKKEEFKDHSAYEENSTFLNPQDYSHWWTNMPTHDFGYVFNVFNYLNRNIDHLKDTVGKNPDYYCINENLEELFNRNLTNTRLHNQFNGKVCNPAKKIMFNKILTKMGGNSKFFEFPLTPKPRKRKRHQT